jgi:hypothetical protein
MGKKYIDLHLNNFVREEMETLFDGIERYISKEYNKGEESDAWNMAMELVIMKAKEYKEPLVEKYIVRIWPDGYWQYKDEPILIESDDYQEVNFYINEDEEDVDAEIEKRIQEMIERNEV